MPEINTANVLCFVIGFIAGFLYGANRVAKFSSMLLDKLKEELKDVYK